MDIGYDLEQSMREESLAADVYRGRAKSARFGGDEASARLWEHIAGEEEGHYNEFKGRLDSILRARGETTYTERMEYLLGHRHPSQVGPGVGTIHEYLISSASFVPPGSSRWVTEKELSELVGSIEYTVLDTREVLPLGEKTVGVPLRRPFPQTYGDWVDLAEDIKGAIGATPAGWDAINYQLQVIATNEGDVDAAKRWLVQKAGELGLD